MLWEEKLVSVLVEMGFIQCEVDPWVAVARDSSNSSYGATGR